MLEPHGLPPAHERLAQAGAGSVTRKDLIRHMSMLTGSIADWDAIRTRPGLVEYARAQYDDAGLDIVAEFTTMRAAAVALRDWLFTNFPKDNQSGGWIVSEYDNAGAETDLLITVPGQLNALSNQLATFIATVG